VIRYPDGTPRTKHVTTNVIVEVEPGGDRAAARSYYTVLQQVEGGALQPVVAGRYHDRFERVDGAWRFAERDYTLVDLVGDVSRHLRIEVAPSTPSTRG
jgi:3-phenylpropionate/cinnamic acid dioxygenase small subunit